MKKYILLISTALSGTLAVGQVYYYTAIPSPLNDSIVRTNGIAEVNMAETHISKKGKSSTYRNVYLYDKSGQMTYTCNIKDTLKYSRLTTSYTYLQHTDKYNSALYNSNFYGYQSMRLSNYDAKNRLSSTYNFDRKGKSKGSTHYEYTDSSQYSRISYYSHKNKLTGYYQYEYGTNRKLIHTALYSGKGKLKRYWDYSCNDEGRMATPKNDTFKVCTNKNYLADGSVITTTNSFDYAGNPRKYVEYTNASGKLYKSMTYKGKKEVLAAMWIYTYNGLRKTHSYVMQANDKGVKTYSASYAYNGQEQMVSKTDSFFQSPTKIRSNHFEYTYNTQGLLSSMRHHNNGRLTGMATYRYRYFKKD